MREKKDVFEGEDNELFAVINAHKVCFEQFGEGKDIVLMHGWGASRTAFLFVAKRLATRYRVTVLDFAGFGDSEEPSEAYDVEKYADDVVKLMQICRISSATFVGHSFGGRVAIYLASHYPDLVQRLVLVDSAGLKPKRKLSYYFKVAAHKILKKLGHKGLSGSSDYRLLSDNMKRTFVKVVNYYQNTDLKNIVAPTVVFWGKEDRETPLYMYRYFLKNIKGAQGFLLNGGHFAYAEDSVKFLAILSAFLQGTD